MPHDKMHSFINEERICKYYTNIYALIMQTVINSSPHSCMYTDEVLLSEKNKFKENVNYIAKNIHF